MSGTRLWSARRRLPSPVLRTRSRTPMRRAECIGASRHRAVLARTRRVPATAAVGTPDRCPPAPAPPVRRSPGRYRSAIRCPARRARRDRLPACVDDRAPSPPTVRPVRSDHRPARARRTRPTGTAPAVGPADGRVRRRRGHGGGRASRPVGPDDVLLVGDSVLGPRRRRPRAPNRRPPPRRRRRLPAPRPSHRGPCGGVPPAGRSTAASTRCRTTSGRPAPPTAWCPMRPSSSWPTTRRSPAADLDAAMAAARRVPHVWWVTTRIEPASAARTRTTGCSTTWPTTTPEPASSTGSRPARARPGSPTTSTPTRPGRSRSPGSSVTTSGAGARR